MYYYKIYNLEVQSEIKLYNLDTIAPTEDTDVKICINPELLVEIPKDNMSFSKEYSFVSTEYAFFTVENGSKITITKTTLPKNDSYYVSFVLGWCFGFLMEQRGYTVFHCSALQINGKSVIVAGASGAGKSTIANELIQSGYKYFNDDMAVINNDGTLEIIPSYPLRKLCSNELPTNVPYQLQMIDEGRDKYSIIDTNNYCSSPQKPDYLFFLELGDVEGFQIEEILGIQKYFTVIKQLYLELLFYYHSGHPENDKYNCLKLAEHMKIYKITRNKDANTKNEIINVIKEYTR